MDNFYETEMQILNLVQGSSEWLTERRENRTASEAPIMMGASNHMTRNELLALKKFGTEKEISDFVQKYLFDKGHEQEALARPIIEKIIQEELYPITGKRVVDGIKLLSSFDGATETLVIGFEHKMWNEDLAAMVRKKELSPKYYWQLEQQLLTGKLEKIIFTVSDGTFENMERMEYYPVPGRAEELIAGWKQFDKDFEAFEAPEAIIVHEIKQIEELPTLSVLVQGSITKSNLEEFNNTALTFIENINTELVTDEDFGNAENTVKFCANAEKELANAKKQILAQTADIDHVFKTIDHLTKSLSVKRLFLDKLVKSQKTLIKQQIVIEAQDKFNEHLRALSENLEGHSTQVLCDFAGAIKGKRNLHSMRNAADTALANGKIEADKVAGLMSDNLTVLNDKAKEFMSLFADLQGIIHKPTDDFTLVVASRIGEHQKAEKEKLDALREQAVIDAQKIVDDKKAEDEATETITVSVPSKAKAQSTCNEVPEPSGDTERLAQYIEAMQAIQTPILSNPALQETLNLSALMIGKALNNLYEAIAESKAA